MAFPDPHRIHAAVSSRNIEEYHQILEQWERHFLEVLATLGAPPRFGYHENLRKLLELSYPLQVAHARFHRTGQESSPSQYADVIHRICDILVRDIKNPAVSSQMNGIDLMDNHIERVAEVFIPGYSWFSTTSTRPVHQIIATLLDPLAAPSQATAHLARGIWEHDAEMLIDSKKGKLFQGVLSHPAIPAHEKMHALARLVRHWNANFSDLLSSFSHPAATEVVPTIISPIILGLPITQMKLDSNDFQVLWDILRMADTKSDLTQKAALYLIESSPQSSLATQALIQSWGPSDIYKLFNNRPNLFALLQFAPPLHVQEWLQNENLDGKALAHQAILALSKTPKNQTSRKPA